jgi:hypothetical protein
MIPGRALHRLANALCAPAFVERVIDPLLADFQHEWLHTEGFSRRVLTLANGYGAFWCTFAIHAARAWRSEILRMSWRDAFPFPGLLAMLIVSLSLSHAWVTTGSVMNARFDQIDTRNMWVLLPMFLLHRWLPVLSSIRAFAIHAVVFAAAAVFLNALVELRPVLRGGEAFLVYFVVMVLVQEKKSIIKASH